MAATVESKRTSDGTLGSVLEYCTAVMEVPGGQFMSGGSMRFRQAICSTYAAPFFALSTLAPELLERPSASVVMGGHVRQWALDGGRWLTLLSRLFQPECKLGFSICAPGKPEPSIGRKEILFQPAQRVLNRRWADHLSDTTDVPDALIIHALHSFDDLWAAVTSDLLATVAERSALLWSSATEAELVIVRQMLRARNFSVTEPVSFCQSPDTPQVLANGAWWIRVTVESAALIRTLGTDERNSYSRCLTTYQSILGTATSREEAGQIAATYAASARPTVDGSELEQVILLTPRMGIDCTTGRMFHSGVDDFLVWKDDRVSPEVMALLPEEDAGRTPSANRFQMMSWIGHAMGNGMQSDAPLVSAKEANDLMVVPARPATVAADCVPPDVAPPAELESQLPLAATAFRKRARLSRGAGITNVLAVAARLGSPGTDASESYDLAKHKVIKWLRNKGFDFDPALDSVAIETPAGEVSIASDTDALWSMRYDDRNQMATGAFWRVELTLLGGEAAVIGLRVAQVRQLETAPPPIPGVPKVVGSIAAEIGLHEGGIVLKSIAWHPSGPRETVRLLEMLGDPARVQPIIVVSTSNGTVHEASIDRLAARLAGVVHVVLVGNDVSQAMIQRFGRNMAVYGNAARLYQPGFNPEADPFNHPLWTFKGLPLPVWVANEISEEACAIGVQAGDLDERVPSFQYVRNLIADRRVKSALQETLEVASSAEEERARQHAVRRELEAVLKTYRDANLELTDSNRQLSSDREALLRERDEALDQVRQLKYQVTTQWQPVGDDADGEGAEEERYPETWDDLETWVECFGNDRLELLPQAAKAARESPFLDIPFAYRVLEFLVEHYVPLRTRDQDDDDTRIRYEGALASLGIELSPVGMAAEDKRYRQEYRRLYNGQKVKLDLHVKRGVGFDGSTLFRLYFWYDSENTKIVVGHFPTHLTNRISHSG